MSSLTQCNFCTMRDIEQLAAKRGGTVHTLPKPMSGFSDGVDVFIQYIDDDTPTWIAWFAQLPKECHCDY